MSPLLSRDQIEQADDLPVEDVDVPEWGGTVRIRGLTGSERDAYEASVVQMRGDKKVFKLQNVRARLVALCLVGGDGERLYSDADVKKLGEKSGKVMSRLFDKARALSGLSDEDIEELAEGLEDGPSDEGGSG